MCFAIPYKIIKIDGKIAQMENGRKVKLGNIKARPGDYLEIYANAAVQKINPDQAKTIRQLIKQSQ